jgi:nucleotide-binding universal stress UspA family protein
MYDHILLPTDGSPGTVAAAEHAGTLARAFDATIHVLSVVDTRNRFESPTGGLAPSIWLSGERDRAADAIDDAVAALPDGIQLEKVQQEGLPQSEIVEYAENNDIDLVVMGTHGRRGLDRFLFGSTAEAVSRRTTVPVMTIRSKRED